MALPVPNLDDRTYDQLESEARSLIPRYFPEWTDHNASDPGITLLELFAFLFEATIYHLNRVPIRSLEHFVELVGKKRQNGEPIAATLLRAIKLLELRDRAVTEDEFETLATQAAPERIARVKVLSLIRRQHPHRLGQLLHLNRSALRRHSQHLATPLVTA